MTFDFSVWCWLWLLAGVILMLLEFVIPGLVICFFGFGAVLMSLLLAVCPELSWNWQLFWFTIFSLTTLFCLRKFIPKIFKGRFGGEDDLDIDNDAVRNAPAVTVSELTPGIPGKVEFRGSIWEAVANEPIPAGTPVVVLKRDNLTLIVRELNK